jgi:puromycin-sensitive aminopeptidase
MKNFSRLPNYIKPERYELVVKPNLVNFTFEGTETIFLKLEKAVKEITLHAKDLKVSDVHYKLDDFRLKASKIIYDKKNETVTLKFSTNLHTGKGEISLKFEGELNNNMRGFYRSRYMHEGKEKHMATTQFEATDARRAFPCFDEPAQKAVFDVTMIVPKHLTAISNTIETSIKDYTFPEGAPREDAGEYKVVKFAPSPKMSTYLLAFIVGDFEYIEGRTRSRTESHGKKTSQSTLVRVFVTPGKKHQAKFALDTAIKCLEFYNKYFDIPYPLPVLDLIAIPDFSHGAMENWGAVTYRETALLVDPVHSSASNKQWVALVIAHELAHQWFGNLVTMEWWTHLWLNEGFASYIEYLAVDHIFPSWDIWTQFAYADLGVALKLDALKHTHPIEIEVGHPDEIGEIFDEISYSKGASIIRMLAGYLGEKNFRDGLRYYLKKHSYKNASTIHLWEAFEKISKKPVEQLMKNWTSQSGYPIVKLIEQPDQIKLEQSRFFSSTISKTTTKNKTVWEIPLNVYDVKTKTHKQILFNSKTSNIKKNNTNPLKFNFAETGFFRVDYPAQMLKALHPAIKSKQLMALDRLGLVRDAFALAEAGELPTTQVLELLKAYINETDYTVWVEILSGLAGLKNLLYGQKFYPKYLAFGREVLKNIGHQVGWQAKKGESHTLSLLRSLILSQQIAFENEQVIKQGKLIYKQHKKVPSDVRAASYQAIAHIGGVSEHKKFIDCYIKETLSEEQSRIGRALGQFSDEKLLKETLKFALSKHVRIQDTPQIFAAVWANPKGKKIAWEFTKQNWKTLIKNYPSSGHILNRFIKPAGGFTSSAQAKDLEKFFKVHKTPSAKRSIDQTLEKIYSNAQWLNRDLNKINNFLDQPAN